MRGTLCLESPALQELRDRYKNLCKAHQGDATILFMWKKDDSIGVAWFTMHA